MPTKEQRSFVAALKELSTIQPLQKRILEERYVLLVSEFERRTFLYAVIFHTCRILVTIGSLIVPALLSIQYTDTTTSASSTNPGDFAYQIYWATWVVSLLVTTSNGIFTLFKVDKKYYLLHSTLEQLRSEGWQYLELSGRFSGFYTPKEVPTHSNQFLFFCHRVEKIKMHQVQEEYWKLEESNHQGKETTATTSVSNQEAHIVNSVLPEEPIQVPKHTKPPTFLTDGLIPPTPLNPTLQQLLQVLTVDGGQTQKTTAESRSEVPVRSKVPGAASSEVSLLRQASGSLSKTESVVRMGTEVSASEVESKPQTSENA
jgi:hypothetical protein